MSELTVACRHCGASNKLLPENFGATTCVSCEQPLSELLVVPPQDLQAFLENSSLPVVAMFTSTGNSPEQGNLQWVGQIMQYLSSLRVLANAYHDYARFVFVPMDLPGAELGTVHTTSPAFQVLNIRRVPAVVIFDGSDSLLWYDINPGWARVQVVLCAMLELQPIIQDQLIQYTPQIQPSIDNPDIEPPAVTSAELNKKLQRFEVLEERAGILIEGLSANLTDYGYVQIRGEVRTLQGAGFAKHISLEFVAYDLDDRVVSTSRTRLETTEIRNFQAFEVSLELNVPWEQMKQIRMYPEG